MRSVWDVAILLHKKWQLTPRNRERERTTYSWLRWVWDVAILLHKKWQLTPRNRERERTTYSWLRWVWDVAILLYKKWQLTPRNREREEQNNTFCQHTPQHILSFLHTGGPAWTVTSSKTLLTFCWGTGPAQRTAWLLTPFGTVWVLCTCCRTANTLQKIKPLL